MKTISKLLAISSLILVSSNLFADESSIQGPMSKPQSRDQGPYRQEKAQKIQEFMKSMDAVANDPGTPPKLKKNINEVISYLKAKKAKKAQHHDRENNKDVIKDKEPMHVSRKERVNKINEIAESVEALRKDPKTSPELKSKLNNLEGHLEKVQKKMKKHHK